MFFYFTKFSISITLLLYFIFLLTLILFNLKIANVTYLRFNSSSDLSEIWNHASQYSLGQHITLLLSM